MLLRFFKYRRFGAINLAFTIKIMGNKSEIKWLKTIDHLCLVVKYTLRRETLSRDVPQEVIDNRMRISGDDLFNSDNTYRVRSHQEYTFPTINDVGLQAPRQFTDQVSMQVRFGIQAYNNLP